MADVDNHIVALLKAWTGTFQPIEDTLQAILVSRSVDQAVGTQLDLLGKLVGQTRGGLTDVDYRRYIRARITTNRSDGVFEDLIKVSSLIVNNSLATFTVKNEGTGTVRVLVGAIVLGDAIAAILYAFLVKAKSGGVRVVLEWFDSAPAGIFRFDSGPGYDVGLLAADLG